MASFPTTVVPKTSRLSSNQPVTKLFSESGKRQAIINGGDLWKVKLTYPSMFRPNMSEMFAFSAKQGSTSFQILIHPHDTHLGTATGTMLVNGAANAGASSVTIDGITGTVLAGSVVKFASHSKVYMVTADRDGAGAMSITPSLIEAVANNEGATYTGVEFTMRFVDDIIEYKTTQPVVSTFEIDLIEAIS